MTIKLSDLSKHLKKIGKAELRATKEALNKVAVVARGDLIDDIAETYNIKKPPAKSKVKILKATVKFPFAFLRVKGASTPLADFKGARRNRQGVSVEILKGKRETIEGAFIAVSTVTGRREILKRIEGARKRIPKSGRYAGTKSLREPVRMLYGPSLSSMVKTVGVDSVAGSVEKNFPLIYKKRLQAQLSKL